MIKKVFIFFTLVGYLLLTKIAFTQNVTINYQTWNPSSPPCNVFASAVNVPATIGGSSGTIEHQSLIGQPVYNTSDKSVQLACKYVSANSSLGTKFRIDYNFKTGYRYIITVSAAELIGTQGYATGPNLRLDLTNTGGGGGACTGAQTIIPDLSGNPAPIKLDNLGFQDKQFPFSTPLTSNFYTLEVSAIPSQITGSDNTIRIRKITIEETAPAVSFTLAPATLNITCGSATPQTFTVTNVHNTPGVTDYNWSLGSTPNGWLYNGSPAPATIQTSVNTLTLTPACQSTHSDIAVSVTAGSNDYPGDNNATVTTSTPVYTIMGDDVICSGSKNYSIGALPCGATVTWTSSDPTLASVSASGNSAILTRNGSGSGTVVLSGAVNSGICGTASVSKTVTVGVQSISSSDIIVQRFGNSCYYDAVVTMSAPSTTVEFSTNNINWYTGVKSGNNFKSGLGQWVGPMHQMIYVRTNNACGMSAVVSKNLSIPKPPGGCLYFQPPVSARVAPEQVAEIKDNIGDKILAYPNPTHGKLIVELSKILNNAVINMYSAHGKLMYSGRLNSTYTELNISSYPPGVYWVKISVDGIMVKDLKVIKQ